MERYPSFLLELGIYFGLQQLSGALIYLPSLWTVNCLTTENQGQAPWCMLFADDSLF